MKNLKWIGKEATLVRKEYGGEKIPLKVGETIEVTDEVSEMYTKGAYSKQFEVMKAVVKKEAVSKSEAKRKVFSKK